MRTRERLRARASLGAFLLRADEADEARAVDESLRAETVETLLR